MKRAGNFGLNIQTIHGPQTLDDLEPYQKLGHDLVTVNVNEILSKASMELLIAVKVVKDQAHAEELEVEDNFGTWRIRKALTEQELDYKLLKEQKMWEEGLRQYLWIAADISNAQPEESRYKPSAAKAHRFQMISSRLGFDVTPFWELEYTVPNGWEKLPDEMSIEHFIEGTVLEA